MFIENNNIMTYDTYRKEENYWVLTKGNEEMYIPSAHLILVDDESGLKAVKNDASRCTVALVREEE